MGDYRTNKGGGGRINQTFETYNTGGISEQGIKAMEREGFNYWKSGDGSKERLYLKSNFGVEIDRSHTKSGDHYFDGKQISSGVSSEIRNTRAYVDVKTGQIFISSSDYVERNYMPQIENFVRKKMQKALGKK